MKVPIRLGKLGYDMESGRIAAWVKQVGDAVERGEPIVEIETDKVTVGMESLASGVLVEVVHGPGDEVRVGTIIGYLDSPT